MMPLRIGNAIVLAALLGPSLAPAADPDADMSVSITPNPVSEHESTQLRVTVDSPLSMPVVQPSFDAPDFTVMGAPGLNFVPESGESGPNTRKRLTFTFVLMPKRAGDFLVRDIRAKAGAQRLSSADIRVKVLPGASTGTGTGQPSPADDREDESTNPASPGYTGEDARPPPPGRASPSLPERFNSDFTVWASLSKGKAYVGEPIVVEYHLYDFGGLRQTEILQWPTFTGFWKEDLELTTHVTFDEVYVRQQEMRRAFIARYALYGIRPGKISVDKLGIRGRYISGDALNPGVFFGFDLRTGQHYSQDLSVEILPLPEAGRPGNFNGAVGRFSLKLEADKLSLSQNTPVTFTVTLAGTGNLQAVDSVKPSLPPDFELYESTVSGRQPPPIGSRQELASTKSFKTVAIPRKAGKFEVPGLSWSFFDPQKEAYETLSTPPLAIEVLPHESGGGGENAYLESQSARPPSSSSGDGLRGLKGAAAYGAKSPLRALSLTVLALLVINLVLSARFLVARVRAAFRLLKGVDPFAGARIALLQAKGIRDAEWQAGMEEVVLITLQVLLQTNPRGLTKQELEEAWKARDLPAPLFRQASALLEELDRHRFSSRKLTGSGTNEVRSRLTRETESVLSEAQRVRRRKAQP